MNTASHNGTEYTFAVRSVTTPMAFRARAILPSGARVSGFGNTKPEAIGNMTARVAGYLDLYHVAEVSDHGRDDWEYVSSAEIESSLDIDGLAPTHTYTANCPACPDSTSCGFADWGFTPPTPEETHTMSTATRFRDLAIGTTFDFVDDGRPGLNSFWDRVRKVSARQYVSLAHPEYRYSVGSINVAVFHVGDSPQAARLDFLEAQGR